MNTEQEVLKSLAAALTDAVGQFESKVEGGANRAGYETAKDKISREAELARRRDIIHRLLGLMADVSFTVAPPQTEPF